MKKRKELRCEVQVLQMSLLVLVEDPRYCTLRTVTSYSPSASELLRADSRVELISSSQVLKFLSSLALQTSVSQLELSARKPAGRRKEQKTLLNS